MQKAENSVSSNGRRDDAKEPLLTFNVNNEKKSEKIVEEFKKLTSPVNKHGQALEFTFSTSQELGGTGCCKK